MWERSANVISVRIAPISDRSTLDSNVSAQSVGEQAGERSSGTLQAETPEHPTVESGSISDVVKFFFFKRIYSIYI